MQPGIPRTTQTRRKYLTTKNTKKTKRKREPFIMPYFFVFFVFFVVIFLRGSVCVVSGYPKLRIAVM
jgi:hypothetical protein